MASKSEQNPLSRHDIVIAVMGATGSGKSSFINIASGRSGGTPGHELHSCTQEVQVVRCPHPCSNIVFLDTPGFDDTGKTDFQILENIATWLNKTYRQGINLTGLLFLHPISDNRMTGTSRRNTNMFSLLCGYDALQNVILVTTMWSEVDEITGASREQELRENYWQAMIEGGCKMMRFNNTFESAWHIVAQFSGIRRPLRLQIEMVDKRKMLSQTAAGRALVRWLTELMDRIQTLIKELRLRLRNINNPKRAKEIEAELVVAREKLKAVKEQKRMARRYNNAIHISISPNSTSSSASLPNSFPSSSPISLPNGAETVQAFSLPNKFLGSDASAEKMVLMPFFRDLLELSMSIVESIEAVKKNKEPPNTLGENIRRFCRIVDEEKAIENTSNIGQALEFLYTELIMLENLLKIFHTANIEVLDDYNGRVRRAYDVFMMRYAILMSRELQESKPCQDEFLADTTSGAEEDMGLDIPDLTGEVITVSKLIAGGGFSYLFKGDYHGVMVAIKVLIPVTQDLKIMNRKMRREREVWGTLSHANIAPFYGYTRGDERAPLGSLISPWYINGDATTYLARHKHELNFSRRKALLQGIVNGVSYLHTREPVIVHGDLKPANILIDDEGNPRLCDFGLARILLQKGSSGLNTTSEHFGTARYLAPELIPSGCEEDEEEVTYPTIPSDIFAIGCTGLEIIFQQLPYGPFQGRRAITKAIKRGDPPAARPIDTTPDIDGLWYILESCWNFEPGLRPNTATILASLEMHNSN